MSIILFVVLSLGVFFIVTKSYPAIVFNKIDEETQTAYINVRSFTGSLIKLKVIEDEVKILSFCGNLYDHEIGEKGEQQ